MVLKCSWRYELAEDTAHALEEDTPGELRDCGDTFK
jgi:hypothetical protein